MYLHASAVKRIHRVGVVMMVVAVVFVVEVECAGACVGGCDQQHFTGGAHRAACNSFRCPPTAQICNNVGLVPVESQFERSAFASAAPPTAQRVSGRRWHAMLDGTHETLAVTSALDCTSS